jgi:signal transduction histidine kinase
MLDEIQGLTEETIQNLRRFTRALRPIYLEDLGLVAALEMLTHEIEQASDLAVGFEKSGSQRRLETTQELALYRVAQEALSNVIRHAQARRAKVDLQFSDQAVVLEVTDDGRGFEVPDSPAEFAPSGHFGLLGMQERAELIGAKLEIKSVPGAGTRIRVELPLDLQQ